MWSSSIMKQPSTEIHKWSTTREAISAGQGDSLTRRRNCTTPNPPTTFSHPSWLSFTYCFRADSSSSKPEIFKLEPMPQTKRCRRFYECGRILRILKYGGRSIEQRSRATMTECYGWRMFFVTFKPVHRGEPR